MVPPLNQEESQPQLHVVPKGPKSSSPVTRINPGTQCQSPHIQASWKTPNNQLLPGGIGEDKSLQAKERVGTAASTDGLSDP